MESYLRNNPGVRWSIIFVLLLCITLEAILIGRSGLFAASNGQPSDPFGGGDTPPTPTTTVLSCRVVNEGGVNMRRQPTTQADNVITTLAVNTPLTPLGRSGEVPWLLVEVAGQQGWVSSKDVGGEALVDCSGDPLTLPEVRVQSSAAETGEQSAVLSARPTAHPTLTAGPSVRLRQGNGPDLHATRRTFAFSADGRVDEWGSTGAAVIGNVVFQPENWQGESDLSGLVRAAWDDEFLYLAVQATDDTLVQENREDLLVRGDAVELFWDADLARDFDVDSYNEDESQMVLSPGNFAGRTPSVWVYNSPSEEFRQPATFTSRIIVGATRTGAGYDIEMQIPWAALGVTPRATAIFGYAVALSDDDSPGSGQQETQIATSPRLPYPHPTHWGNFILEP